MARKALAQLQEIPEAEAIPIVEGKEIKGRTDYSKEDNIYLKQKDRDRLEDLEKRKKTLTPEEKHEMTNLKNKRRQNKHQGKKYA